MELEKAAYWKSLINMSLSKFFILQTLHQGPTHGYAFWRRCVFLLRAAAHLPTPPSIQS